MAQVSHRAAFVGNEAGAGHSVSSPSNNSGASRSPAGFDFSECDKEYQDEIDALEDWARNKSPWTEDDQMYYDAAWKEAQENYERCTNSVVSGEYSTHDELGISWD